MEVQAPKGSLSPHLPKISVVEPTKTSVQQPLITQQQITIVTVTAFMPI